MASVSPLSTSSPSKSSSGRSFHTTKSPRATKASTPQPPVHVLAETNPIAATAAAAAAAAAVVVASTALPPLVGPFTSSSSGNGNGAESPRSPRVFRPPAPPLHLDYPVAQLDAWPLTSTSYYGHPTSSSCSPLAPLSPRARKTHARHKLLDESKSKPLLLQELQAFLSAELAAIGSEERPHDHDHNDEKKTNRKLNLQRLQVFRELFSRVIDAFTVYAPLLARIKSEYDATVDVLLLQTQRMPQLQSELESLETQCLHELSKFQLETKSKLKTLTSTLKTTQAQLTACAAQNAHLLDDKLKLTELVSKLEQRHDEMQLSNHTLVSGLKRQDETLRHIHDRSRDESAALQQMALKYHRACDEIAELKLTVASLEDKVGGVHVAADKATIALLTRELQDLHAKLQPQAPGSGDPLESTPTSNSDSDAVVMNVVGQVLEANGVMTSHAKELLEMVQQHSRDGGAARGARLLSNHRSQSTASLSTAAPSDLTASDVALGIESVVRQLNDQIAQFHYQQLQLQHRTMSSSSSSTTTTSSSTSKNATFLTEEPEEITSTAALLLQLHSTNDLIQTRGSSDASSSSSSESDVPEYLQYDGVVVRNLYFDRRRVELLLAKVWAHKDDLDAKTKRSPSTSTSGYPLAQAFSLYLQRCFPSSKHDQAECAYNVVASLERFSSTSSDCRLFLLTLRGQLPDGARGDQAKELFALHEALATLQRELKTQTSSHRPAIHATTTGLPLAEVVRALRRQFPWKSDAQLSALHRALLVDQHAHGHGHHSMMVDYSSLLALPHDGSTSTTTTTKSHRTLHRPKTKSQFVECLRAQYVDDLLAFRLHIERRVQQTIQEEQQQQQTTDDTSNSGSDSQARPSMVSVRVLRECLQRCDVAKPVQEINSLLSHATGLSMDQILTQDAMVVSASQFLTTLPTLLVKPSGKFKTMETTLGAVVSESTATLSSTSTTTTTTTTTTTVAAATD